MSFLRSVHRLLCFVRGHTWTTVAAGHPLQQCIYCERVLEVALLTVLVVAGLSALALAAAGYLRSHLGRRRPHSARRRRQIAAGDRARETNSVGVPGKQAGEPLPRLTRVSASRLPS